MMRKKMKMRKMMRKKMKVRKMMRKKMNTIQYNTIKTRILL